MAAAGRDPGPLPADAAQRRRGPASPPASSTRRRRSSSARRAPTPSFKGYRGFPGSICASPNSMVVHGIPGPYELQARRHRSRSTSASSTTAGSPTRRSPSRSARSAAEARKLLDVDQGVAVRRRRAGAAGQPPRRRLRTRSSAGSSSRASRSSAPWSATGSAATCTRTRRSPTSASPARARELEEGMVLAIEPMVNAGGPRGADGRRRLGGLLRRTTPSPPTSSSPSPSPPTGPRILTPWHEAD